MKFGSAQFHDAIAKDFMAGPDNASFQRRQGNDHLEGGAGRVLSRDGLVDQRFARMLHQGPPGLVGHPEVKGVWVIAGRRYHGQDIALVDVHDHGGGTFIGQAPGDFFLQSGINGQDNIFAGLAVLARQLPDLPAIGVDLDLGIAGLARLSS